MEKIVAVFFCLVSFTLPNLSQAQNNEDGWGLGFKVGSTGLGLELTRSLTDTINLRGSYNFFEIDEDINDTEVNYDGEFRKNSIGLLADWHPWDGDFRLSAGIYYHFDNEINIVATPTTSASFIFNDTVFDATNIGSVDGDIGFKRTTPYLGIGWGNAAQPEQRFAYILEFGVQFQDSPSANLAASNCTLPLNGCAELDAAVLAEVIELEHEINDFKLWPVLSIGFSYRF